MLEQYGRWMDAYQESLSVSGDDLPGARPALDDAIMSARRMVTSSIDNFGGILERFAMPSIAIPTRPNSHKFGGPSSPAMITLPLNEFTLDPKRSAYGPRRCTLGTALLA